MPSSFTMFARRQMLRAMFAPNTFTPLDEVQVALTLSIPPANVTAAQLLEPSSASYARVTYAIGSLNWAPTNFGEFFNAKRISFPTIAGEEWGMIRGWALIDPTSEQCLNVGSQQQPFRGIIGMTPRLEPGAVMLGIYD